MNCQRWLIYRSLVDQLLAHLGKAFSFCSESQQPELRAILLRAISGEQKHADWIAARLDELAG